MNLTFITPTVAGSPLQWKQRCVTNKYGSRHDIITGRRHAVRQASWTACQSRDLNASISRRDMLTRLLAPVVLASLFPAQQASAAAEATRGEATPSATGPLSDADAERALQELREVTGLQDLAFEYTNRYEFAQAEILWTKLISLNDQNAAAFSNRGNCRTSQGKFDDAVSDFNRAISLSPEEPDPYLGKGVALEGLKQYRDALQAYEEANRRSLTKYRTADAVAINNMGNAHGALGEWDDAFTLYKQAADMDSRFVFALANEALALYQLGRDDEGALKKMKFLTRKYQRFADMHAAVAMALWEKGSRTQAEDEWFKAVGLDARYEDVAWVRDFRRWPPRLLSILQRFRNLSK